MSVQILWGCMPSSPKEYNYAPLTVSRYIFVQVLSKQTASSCLSRCREQGIEYFRFNPELKRKVDSDQQNSTILQEMILTTRQYLNEEEVKKDMDWLIQLLRESDLTST